MQQRQPPVKVQFPHVRLPLTETIQLFSCRHTSFFCAAPPPRPVRKRNGKTTSCSFRRESFHFVCTLKSFQISARNFSHVALLYFCQGEGGDGEKCATDLKWLVAGIRRRRRRRRKKDSRTISSAVSSLKFNCINFNRENLLTDRAREQSWGVCVGVFRCVSNRRKKILNIYRQTWFPRRKL